MELFVPKLYAGPDSAHAIKSVSLKAYTCRCWASVEWAVYLTLVLFPVLWTLSQAASHERFWVNLLLLRSQSKRSYLINCLISAWALVLRRAASCRSPGLFLALRAGGVRAELGLGELSLGSPGFAAMSSAMGTALENPGFFLGSSQYYVETKMIWRFY